MIQPLPKREFRVLKLLPCNTRNALRHRRMASIVLLFGLLLTACAGDVPIPFMNTTLPPAPENPPPYPSIASPVVGENQVPVMTESERQVVEDQLKQLVQDRESNVKKRIDKSN